MARGGKGAEKETERAFRRSMVFHIFREGRRGRDKVERVDRGHIRRGGRRSGIFFSRWVGKKKKASNGERIISMPEELLLEPSFHEKRSR